MAEEEQFSSATTLRLVDLEGLPRDNTIGALNMRSSSGKGKSPTEPEEEVSSGEQTQQQTPQNVQAVF